MQAFAHVNTPAKETHNAIAAHRPAILAPAGNREAFLAALAAGADEIYCGLKSHSARMAAHNFTIQQLQPLVALAHAQDTAVYITLNTLLTPKDLGPVGTLLSHLTRQVHPDGLIFQDPGMIALARQAGFEGELHMSTLANVSFPDALGWLQRRLNVHRIVVPRELSIDEIKQMAQACPSDLSLEAFIHGALCYGVSGRCYWSSFLGGKSGLRGRCVQPCRRRFTQDGAHLKAERHFSCRDLGLDVLVKILRPLPQVSAWKIEGRKKGPHYVYHTVRAYRLLRDEGTDPAAKKQALVLLDAALGRPKTHYRFLPQRVYNPLDIEGHTGSGKVVGKVKGAGRAAYFNAYQALLPGDVLRIGYEDDSSHQVIRIRRRIPKRGRFVLPGGSQKRAPGAPVFLIDRRENWLAEKIAALEARLIPPDPAGLPKNAFTPRWGRPKRKLPAVREMRVHRSTKGIGKSPNVGLWVGAAGRRLTGAGKSTVWHWLPPVIWPDQQTFFAERIQKCIAGGSRCFVLNAPWQRSLFPEIETLRLWAGPFCNLANEMALQQMARLGFEGAFVSPELGRDDYLRMPRQSPIPLGIVLSAWWPLSLSRIVGPQLASESIFTSPRDEKAWVRFYDGLYWVFPNWKLDLGEKRRELERAGYRMFAHLEERLPAKLSVKSRPGLWNWKINLQ